MADFKSERFHGAQLLGTWIFGLGMGCFFITACQLVCFIAVLSQGNALASSLAFIISIGGIFVTGMTGLMFLWGSFALRLMVSIEHNTHVVSDMSVVAGRISQDTRVVR